MKSSFDAPHAHAESPIQRLNTMSQLKAFGARRRLREGIARDCRLLLGGLNHDFSQEIGKGDATPFGLFDRSLARSGIDASQIPRLVDHFPSRARGLDAQIVFKGA